LLFVLCIGIGIIRLDVGNDFVVEADLVIFIVVEASEEGIGKRSSEN